MLDILDQVPFTLLKHCLIIIHDDDDLAVTSMLLPNFEKHRLMYMYFFQQPLNGYMLFSIDHRGEVLKQCKGVHNAKVSTILAELWYNLSPDDKKVYEDLADQQV